MKTQTLSSNYITQRENNFLGLFTHSEYHDHVPDITQDIKDELKRIIKARDDLTQDIVAKELDIAQSTLSMFLSGERDGKPSMLFKIAKICGTTIGEIERQIEDKREEKADAPQAAANLAANTVNETVIDFGAVKANGLSHEDVITKFKDKTTAKEINYMLVEIEAENQDAYETVCDAIRTTYERIARRKAAKDGTGTDRASGED